MQNEVWQSDSSLPVLIGAAFLWGAIHSLSPGHGKTVVGAYLVGSRATVQHALFLGLTTTIAHSTGVFALGLVALFASEFILPEQVYPWLSFLSGIIVFFLGLNLCISRWKSTRRLKNQVTHSHDLEIVNNADHFHDHHHHHDHSHLPTDADGDKVSWSSLLALGISSGITPCPSALVVLLAAIALGKIGFGLVMILAFSLGMAGALTGLGLLLVKAKKLFGSLPHQSKLVTIIPAISALLISFLGLGMTMQALLTLG